MSLDRLHRKSILHSQNFTQYAKVEKRSTYTKRYECSDYNEDINLRCSFDVGSSYFDRMSFSIAPRHVSPDDAR